MGCNIKGDENYAAFLFSCPLIFRSLAPPGAFFCKALSERKTGHSMHEFPSQLLIQAMKHRTSDSPDSAKKKSKRI